MLCGGAKANKSFVGLEMAYSLATGTPLFNAYMGEVPIYPVPKACRVLYVEQEIGYATLQERLHGRFKTRTMDGIEWYIKSKDVTLKLDEAAGYAALCAEIAQVAPDVVILDPLKEFHDRDENSSQEMGYILRRVNECIAQFNTTFIIIHHSGIPNPMFPRSGGYKMRGSSVLYGWCDSSLTLELLSEPSAAEQTMRMDFSLRHEKAPESIRIKRLLDGTIQYLGPVQASSNDGPKPYTPQPFAPRAFSKR